MNSRRVMAAGAVGLAVFALLWELLVRALDVKPFILLAPTRIASELADRPSYYLGAMGVTARHAVLGLAIAIAGALLLGALLSTSRFLEHAVQPVLMLILVAPWVAYFASIVVWLGRGDPPVIFLVAFVTTPAYVFATVAGLRSADPDAREVLRSVDASRAEVLLRLRLPSALPALLATSRYGAALALAAAYYGEGGNLTSVGLGAIGRRAASAQSGAVLWASVVATVLLGVALLVAIAAIERVALRWHVSQRRAPHDDGGDRGAVTPPA